MRALERLRLGGRVGPRLVEGLTPQEAHLTMQIISGEKWESLSKEEREGVLQRYAAKAHDLDEGGRFFSPEELLHAHAMSLRRTLEQEEGTR
jgi:hypothetical protein